MTFAFLFLESCSVPRHPDFSQVMETMVPIQQVPKASAVCRVGHPGPMFTESERIKTNTDFERKALTTLVKSLYKSLKFGGYY